MAQLIQEVKRFQYLAGLIKEEEANAELEQIFSQFGKELAGKVEDALEDKQLQNEVLVTAATILGFVLSAPVIGMAVGRASKLVFGKLGVEKGEKFGEWLEHNSHELEHLIKSPLYSVVGKFTKDAGKQKVIAESIYAVIVAGLALYAGFNVLKALDHADVGHAAIDLVKLATKGKDISDFANSLV